MTVDVIAGVAALAAALGLASLTRGRLPWFLIAVAATVALARGQIAGLYAVRDAAAALLCVTLLSLSAIHLYWAAGGRGGLAKAVPHIDSATPVFRPPRGATALVGVILAVIAALAPVAAYASYSFTPRPYLPILCAALGVMFILRAFGDTRYVGVLKTVRDTDFARWDDRLFNPLCWWLGTLFVLVGV